MAELRQCIQCGTKLSLNWLKPCPGCGAMRTAVVQDPPEPPGQHAPRGEHVEPQTKADDDLGGTVTFGLLFLFAFLGIAMLLIGLAINWEPMVWPWGPTINEVAAERGWVESCSACSLPAGYVEASACPSLFPCPTPAPLSPSDVAVVDAGLVWSPAAADLGACLGHLQDLLEGWDNRADGQWLQVRRAAVDECHGAADEFGALAYYVPLSGYPNNPVMLAVFWSEVAAVRAERALWVLDTRDLRSMWVPEGFQEAIGEAATAFANAQPFAAQAGWR